MKGSEILDDDYIGQESLKWSHFIIFYLVSVLFILLTFVLSKIERIMIVENSIVFLTPPILSYLMIKTYSTDRQLRVLIKMKALIFLIVINFVIPCLINYVDLFNRHSFSEDELIRYINHNSIYGFVMFIICFIIISLTKNRINLDK